jgi:parallel beta-helix repeat protein
MRVRTSIVRVAAGLAVVVGLALVWSQQAAAANTIRVPLDQPTIQAGIDFAASGDVVLVAAGTYFENIDFKGKNITVKSESGRKVTIIDGSNAGPVVRISASFGQQPVLRGFTITHGASEGGVVTTGGSPVIEKNKITANTYCGEGGGVDASFSGAIIRRNMISNNRQQGCSGGPGGGGIAVRGAGTVQVLNNVISGKSHGSFGGGITLFAAGAPTISGNRIQNNSAGNEGGGIWIVNQSDATIVNNIITGNTTPGDGGGIYWLVPSGAVGPAVVNNTIASNSAGQGSAVFADGFDAQAKLVNNILTGSGGAAVLFCGNFNDPNPPQISFDDVWNSTGGPRYGGICPDSTGTNGNISGDPLFAKKFHLQRTSPAVDAGTNSGAPPRDIDGNRRPLDGDGDGSEIVDMGADEVKPI